MNPSKESILKARRWFYQYHLRKCKYHIQYQTDVIGKEIIDIVEYHKVMAIETLAGKWDTYTLLNKARYIQDNQQQPTKSV